MSVDIKNYALIPNVLKPGTGTSSRLRCATQKKKKKLSCPASLSFFSLLHLTWFGRLL